MATRPKDTIRFALIEDDPATRLLVRLAADLDPRYDLVAEFESLKDAVPGLLNRDVDVVIVDRLHQDRRTMELFIQLRVAVGAARVVVVAHEREREPVPTSVAVAAGADAFLDRTAFTSVADALQLATGRLHRAA